MKEWESAVRQLQNAGIGIGIARSTEKGGQQSGIDQWTLIMELPDWRRKVVEADERIREQVRLELLGKHDGHAEEAATEPPSSS